MKYQNMTPQSTVRRLPLYLRKLDHLIESGIQVTSSQELSSRTGFTAEQIRKDLAYFGAFGTRGKGYNTKFLREKILKIIGLDEQTNIVVVGVGHLGIAITRYNVTKNPYVNVAAAFDIDPAIVGKKILDVEVLHISRLKETAKKQDIRAAVLTVPAEHAQAGFQSIVESGINVIYNFAPVKLPAMKGIYVHNADLSAELQSIIYYATMLHKEKNKILAKK
ncbi:MAG: redox-sensing transcriptional repressor Rex [Firmicutes bacterium]|nr:redox-sensing transcriptional repressor Rex [Bacillota bacterium]